mmetsp:Transcript_2928/g.10443  ORF Transcript_2928/g.10443 Transcript_2928/m.10443 type:complete len:624 (+) Transcript_2928:1988-3859(+)
MPNCCPRRAHVTLRHVRAVLAEAADHHTPSDGVRCARSSRCVGEPPLPAPPGESGVGGPERDPVLEVRRRRNCSPGGAGIRGTGLCACSRSRATSATPPGRSGEYWRTSSSRAGMRSSMVCGSLPEPAAASPTAPLAPCPRRMPAGEWWRGRPIVAARPPRGVGLCDMPRRGPVPRWRDRRGAEPAVSCPARGACIGFGVQCLVRSASRIAAATPPSSSSPAPLSSMICDATDDRSLELETKPAARRTNGLDARRERSWPANIANQRTRKAMLQRRMMSVSSTRHAAPRCWSLNSNRPMYSVASAVTSELCSSLCSAPPLPYGLSLLCSSRDTRTTATPASVCTCGPDAARKTDTAMIATLRSMTTDSNQYRLDRNPMYTNPRRSRSCGVCSASRLSCSTLNDASGTPRLYTRSAGTPPPSIHIKCSSSKHGTSSAASRYRVPATDVHRKSRNAARVTIGWLRNRITMIDTTKRDRMPTPAAIHVLEPLRRRETRTQLQTSAETITATTGRIATMRKRWKMRGVSSDSAQSSATKRSSSDTMLLAPSRKDSTGPGHSRLNPRASDTTCKCVRPILSTIDPLLLGLPAVRIVYAMKAVTIAVPTTTTRSSVSVVDMPDSHISHW